MARAIVLFFVLVLAQRCVGAEKISLFASASTRDAVAKIAKSFTAESGIEVEVVPGPSSALAKQIEQGGQADLFLSADQPTADFLQNKQLIAKRRNLLANSLVVVVPADSKLQFTGLKELAGKDVTKIALTEAKVPAGEYARAALRKVGVLEAVQDRIVGGVDVRSTLQFVARGEVEAGIVYRTDAQVTSKVRVALAIKPELHEPILYPLVLLNREKPKAGAAKLFDYLGSDKAAEVFKAAGFTLSE